MAGHSGVTLDGLREYCRRHPRLGTFGGRWAGPQGLVEQLAARVLAEELAADGVRNITTVRKREERSRRTPPDCLVTSENGGIIGIEATELLGLRRDGGTMVGENVRRAANWRRRVDELCRQGLPPHRARLQAMGESPQIYIDWTFEGVVLELSQIIEKKNRCRFEEDDDVPYTERWLVIYTDEPTLHWGEYRDRLARHEFDGPVQFDSMFLLWDWCPGLRRHPYVQLTASVESAAKAAGT